MKKLIWLLFLFGIFISCSEEKIQPQVERSNNQNEIPTNESWNLKMMFTDEGRIKAILYTDHGSMFETQRITLLNGVKVHFYNKEQKNTSWLTSLRGKIDDLTKNMFAIDSVVAWNDSGTVLKTNELMWRNKDQKIVTDKFVTISSPKEIIQGYGFESDQHLDRYVIHNVTYSTSVSKKKK